MTEAELELDRYRKLFDDAAHAECNYPADRFSGRGIVIPAGGTRMFGCAWVAIRMLRDHLGCRLPIEVWHLGREEMSPAMAAILAEQDVEIVDAHRVAKEFPARILGGWELKPFAIMHCRFQEVILLDADNVPIQDPTRLFDEPEYLRTGAIFWPDVTFLVEDSPIWGACGVASRNMPSFESGQIVLDKAKCWAALSLTLLFNMHSDFFYKYVHGDKDTFMLAWLRLDQQFARPDHPVLKLVGTVCQHDFAGQRIFQHRNRRKWVVYGFNAKIEGFREEERCFDYLAELRLIWNGRIFNPPDATEATRQVEAELIEQRWFDYELVSIRIEPLELLPCNRIGEGHNEIESYWWLEDDGAGEIALIVGSDCRRSVRLTRDPFGVWHGSWNVAEMAPVLFTPRDGPPPPISVARGHNTETIAEKLRMGLWSYQIIETAD